MKNEKWYVLNHITQEKKAFKDYAAARDYSKELKTNYTIGTAWYFKTWKKEINATLAAAAAAGPEFRPLCHKCIDSIIYRENDHFTFNGCARNAAITDYARALELCPLKKQFIQEFINPVSFPGIHEKNK